MKTSDIILIGFGVLVLIMILLDIVSSIYSITRGREGHAKVMQTQEVIQASVLRSVPFEATGFTATRMKDDRIMLSFTRPHPEIKDRELIVDVILSPENFEYVSKFVREREVKRGEP